MRDFKSSNESLVRKEKRRKRRRSVYQTLFTITKIYKKIVNYLKRQWGEFLDPGENSCELKCYDNAREIAQKVS